MVNIFTQLSMDRKFWMQTTALPLVEYDMFTWNISKLINEIYTGCVIVIVSLVCVCIVSVVLPKAIFDFPPSKIIAFASQVYINSQYILTTVNRPHLIQTQVILGL